MKMQGNPQNTQRVKVNNPNGLFTLMSAYFDICFPKLCLIYLLYFLFIISVTFKICVGICILCDVAHVSSKT